MYYLLLINLYVSFIGGSNPTSLSDSNGSKAIIAGDSNPTMIGTISD